MDIIYDRQVQVVLVVPTGESVAALNRRLETRRIPDELIGIQSQLFESTFPSEANPFGRIHRHVKLQVVLMERGEGNRQRVRLLRQEEVKGLEMYHPDPEGWFVRRLVPFVNEDIDEGFCLVLDEQRQKPAISY